MKDHDLTIHLVDLPGTYSLTSYTGRKPSPGSLSSAMRWMSSSMWRMPRAGTSLYLTLQLLELGKPVVLALNDGHCGKAGHGDRPASAEYKLPDSRTVAIW